MRSHASVPAPRPLTIAHRGASGYLPEHSLAAKALAHAMGAEFIEQDVVVTADDELIVLHDIHLEQVTDVATRFTDRSREDGRYYARDFSLAEIKQLRLRERVGNDGKPVFATRFPEGFTPFAVPTLAEELALIRGLNSSRQATTGIYPEIKKPEWHRQEGVDIAPLLLRTLEAFDYPATPEQVWLQCFDRAENTRLRQHWAAPYRLVQLIGDDSWKESTTRYAELLSPGGLTALKGTVDGIGPWIPQLVMQSDGGERLGTHLIEEAHALDLQVHPYTLRADALPSGFETLEDLLAFLTREGIDGIFCDFPDRSVAYFDNQGFGV